MPTLCRARSLDDVAGDSMFALRGRRACQPEYWADAKKTAEREPAELPVKFMTASKSIAFRALVAVFLMVGFYLLAMAIVVVLLCLLYADVKLMDHISIRFALFCIFGVIAILWSILPRVDQFEPPGPLLQPGQFPKLFKELLGIATATGQAMPAEVYLTHDVNAWVSQRGGVMGFGGRRVMGVGLPLMNALTILQFKAVLAHEFGHYYGGDTKLGPWVYKTRSAIGRTVQSLAGEHGGKSLLQMPFLWYGRVFLRITNAVSRRQEFTADELAARMVGVKALVTGLTEVHRMGPGFEEYWQNHFLPFLGAGHRPPLLSGFREFMQSRLVKESISRFLEQELRIGKSDPYDTHPSLKERIAAVEALPHRDEPDDQRMAMSLLSDETSAEESALEVLVLEKLLKVEVMEKLRPAAWDQEGDLVAVPNLQRLVRDYGALLAGWTPESSLPAAAADPKELMKKFRQCLGPAASDQEVFGLMSATLGAALALALLKQGWTLVTKPGSPLTLRRESQSLDPFGIMEGLAKQQPSAEDWQRWCASAGISGVDLGAGSGSDLDRRQRDADMPSSIVNGRGRQPSPEDIGYAALACGNRLEAEGRVQEALEVYQRVVDSYPGTDAGHDAKISIESLRAKLG